MDNKHLSALKVTSKILIVLFLPTMFFLSHLFPGTNGWNTRVYIEFICISIYCCGSQVLAWLLLSGRQRWDMRTSKFTARRAMGALLIPSDQQSICYLKWKKSEQSRALFLRAYTENFALSTFSVSWQAWHGWGYWISREHPMKKQFGFL